MPIGCNGFAHSVVGRGGGVWAEGWLLFGLRPRQQVDGVCLRSFRLGVTEHTRNLKSPRRIVQPRELRTSPPVDHPLSSVQMPSDW